MSLLVFLLGLPLAVYTLAGFFALIDFSDKSRALVILSARLLINLCLLLLFGAHHWPWLLTAYAVVVVLHLGCFFAVRRAVSSGRWVSERLD
jgi:hypothetical protein